MIGLLNKSNIWLQNIGDEDVELFDVELYNFGIPYMGYDNLIKPKLEGDNYIEGATQEDIDFHNSLIYPNSVTALQFKMQLLKEGLSESVNNAINSLKEPEKSIAKLKYEYATEFIRTDELVLSIGEMIGKDKQGINDFFLNSSKL